MFYVISETGKPLMPTVRYRHTIDLLKSGRARKVCSVPFTVQLLYPTQEKTQPLTLGIDPGRTNIGAAVVKDDGTPVFEAQAVTRNKEVPKLMAKRKVYRNKHRNYGRRKKRIRRAKASGSVNKNGTISRILPGCKKPVNCNYIKNKQAKFNNRTRKEGWLTPTANQLLQTHINLVKKLQKFLPISRIVLEINQFAFMELDDPHIQRWMYQKGPLHGYGSVEEAVFEQQGGHCLFCDKAIDEYHHVKPRSKGGSETLANRVGLCKEHHRLVHTDDAWHEKLESTKAGLNKKYGALSVLNQIIPALFKELTNLGEVFATTGYSTAEFRKANSITKSHNADAYCIACSVLDNPNNIVTEHNNQYLIQQFRRQDRQACSKENLNRVYLDNKKPVTTNRHKAMTQTNDSLEEYVTNGGRTDNLTVKPHPPAYKRMDRIKPGALFEVDGQYKVLRGSAGLHSDAAGNKIPNYYVFTDDSKATPKHCRLMKHNTGLVFLC